MDYQTANYIMTYFSSLQNDKEKLANRHISSIIKLGYPSIHLAATEVYKRVGWLTDDEEALTLVKLGEEGFKIKVAERILLEYKDQVLLNYCLKCNRLARTPAARQCRHCGHDWH